MAGPKFSIPSEFASELRNVDVADRRTDEEILASLCQNVPVSSEKNIWAFWDKGVRKMPGWCQRNVCDWIRICGGHTSQPWTVRVLDAIPDSPNYALKFVPKDMLPQAFVDGEMTGPYVGPHSADFLRGACLYLHGGVYMDVGCILLRHLDRVGWNELEDAQSPYQIAVPIMYGNTIANHFVMSRRGNPFIKRWHDLFTHLWEGKKDHIGLSNNPLIQIDPNESFDASRASNFHWDFKVDYLTVLEYIGQVLSWRRLTTLEDAGDGFSCSEYWQKHILVFDVLQEDWPAEDTVGFQGSKLLAAFSTPLHADPESEEYKTAYKTVWRMLTRASMQKITHGKHLTHSPALGVLWEMPENENKDMEPGTFAELLRYGSVRFQQTRNDIVRMEAKRPPKTVKKGVFEP